MTASSPLSQFSWLLLWIELQLEDHTLPSNTLQMLRSDVLRMPLIHRALTTLSSPTTGLKQPRKPIALVLLKAAEELRERDAGQG